MTAAVDSWEQQDLAVIDRQEHLTWWERTRGALRLFCEEQTYEKVAEQLDAVFGDSAGRHVSPSLLRATLAADNRNYFRLEWLFLFAKRSQPVRRLLDEMLAEGSATPEEELEAVYAELDEHGRTGRDIRAAARNRLRRRRRR